MSSSQSHSQLCLPPVPVQRADAPQSRRVDQEVCPQSDSIDVGALLKDAVEHTPGATHQDCSYRIGYHPISGMWQRILSGERGMALKKLGMLPRAVQIELLARWAEALGVRLERRAAQSPDPASWITTHGVRVTRVRITLETVA